MYSDRKSNRVGNGVEVGINGVGGNGMAAIDSQHVVVVL